MPTHPSNANAIPSLRIGMLTPSSNTVLEPATAAMVAPLADTVSVHFGRFRVTRIALDSGADAQFALDPILAAADLLADARPSLIAWNGTSASWRGFDTDERLCAMIEERTGCRATSAIVGLNRALHSFGAAKLGLVTPYTEDVEAAIAANYARAGIETVAARRADLSENFAFAGLGPADVARMCREVAAAKPDAIVVVCTNMRGPMIAAGIEAEFGIPVLDSIAVTLWGALNELDVDTMPLARFGQVFTRKAAR